MAFDPAKTHVYAAIGIVIVLFLVGVAMESLWKLPIATQAIMNCMQVLFVGVVAAFGFETTLLLLRKYRTS